MTFDIRDLIAKAREIYENAEPTDVPVEFNGEIVTIGVKPVLGHVWSNLTAINPPRPTATLDSNVGYNADAVTAGYPVERLTVNGDQPSEDTWRDLVDVLTVRGRQDIASALWGLNWLEPSKRLREAQEAADGKTE